MKIKLPAYLFYFTASVQPGLSQADSILAQDINLATYPYPFSVKHLTLSVQNRQLQMAYKPGKPNGNAVVLLHGKNFIQNGRAAIGKDLVADLVAKTMGNYPLPGRITQSKIKGSKLVELANTGHLPHGESFEKFINTLTLFLKAPDKNKV
jgi:hypothetical protein